MYYCFEVYLIKPISRLCLLFATTHCFLTGRQNYLVGNTANVAQASY